MLLRLAWRNLWRNKRRTYISAASIFCAVFFALLMRSLQNGVYDNMIENAVGYYTGYAQVQHQDFILENSIDNALDQDETIEKQLTDHSNVKAVVPRLAAGALASAGQLTKFVFVTGINPVLENEIVNLPDKMVSGHYFAAQDEQIIIAEGLAEYLKLSVNDTLVLLGQGYHGTSGAGKYAISGIARFGSPDLNNTMAFLPLPAAQRMMGAEGKLTSYLLVCDKVGEVEATVADINNSLPEELQAQSWKEILPELIQLIEADNAAGIVLIFILYVIIGFGIFGTVLMMTNERMYEFGVLISIGMKRWRLMLMIFLESTFISMVGVVMGIIISIPVLTWFHYNPISLGADLQDFSERYDMEPVLNFSLDPSIFYTQGFFVLLMALIISCYPMYVIFRLKVVEALRA